MCSASNRRRTIEEAEGLFRQAPDESIRRVDAAYDRCSGLMSEETETRNGRRASEVLAEETGEPESEFEYDGGVPDAEDQEWESIDDE